MSAKKCSDICTNTFGGYECSCSDTYRYFLSSDNHTCTRETQTTSSSLFIFIFISLTARCFSPCKNGGKCVAFNRCSCPDGYTHDDCSVCMSKRSNLPMSSYSAFAFSVSPCCAHQWDGTDRLSSPPIPLLRSILFVDNRSSSRKECRV